MVLHAVVIYLHTELLPRAYAICAEQGWLVKYAVPTERYDEAVRLAVDEHLIVVAASPDSVDPDRIPRLVIIPDEDDGSSESHAGHGAPQ